MKNIGLKSLIFTALSIILAVSTFALPATFDNVVSADENAAYSETAVSQNAKTFSDFLEGEGTVENPYLIYDADDFIAASQAIAVNGNLYASSVYSIENCLDFEGKVFVPFGTAAYPFNGTLLGNNHRLKNITVRNEPVFAIVAYLTGGNISGIHAEYKSGSYDVSELEVFGGIAGLISSESVVRISNCSVKGSITLNTGLALRAGGFMGSGKAEKADFSVTDCISDIDLSVNSNSDGYVGGFVGHLETSSGKNYVYSRCVSYSNITFNTASTLGSTRCGGFVGYANKDQPNWSEWVSLLADDTSFESCIVFGNVNSVAQQACITAEFAGYFGEYLKWSKCAISSSQTVTVPTNNKVGTVYNDTDLRNAEYLETNFGFDFDGTYMLDESSTMCFSKKCTSCVPTLTITADGVKASCFDNGVTLVVSSYSGSVLLDIKFVTVDCDFSKSFEEIGVETDGADTVKAFVFVTTQALKPAVESVSVNL